VRYAYSSTAAGRFERRGCLLEGLREEPRLLRVSGWTDMWRCRGHWQWHADETDLVREIFRRYAAGEGLRTIAKDLNTRAVEPPRAGRRGTGSWAYGSIREMVRRERYRGVLVWGKKEKTYKGGTKVRVDRPKSDWVTIEAPELRIVDDELWAAVQQRWIKRETLTGSRRRGGRVRYFLTGFGRCAKCGGPMRAGNAKVSDENVRVYACAWHRDRGPAVCDNGLRRPVATVDEAVINCIKENVLPEEVIAEALREMRRRLAERAKSVDNELPQLEREASRLRVEIDRLVDALASIDQKPEAVIRGIAERQDQLSRLEARLRAAKAAPSALDLAVRRLEREARHRLGDLRAMLERNPEEARKALETILGGPLRFTPIETPEGKRYRIEGVIALEAVVAVEGDRARVVQGASPAGLCSCCW
jgi:site-specific DNA recombinase